MVAVVLKYPFEELISLLALCPGWIPISTITNLLSEILSEDLMQCMINNFLALAMILFLLKGL